MLNKQFIISLIRTHRLFVLLLLLTITTSLYLNFSNPNWKYNIISSDGRGYYAYLPALLIYNDATYAKSMKAERDNYEHGIGQLYLNELEGGRYYNKCYPGVAVLQAPFFLGTCGILKLMGKPVTGYSTAFLLSLWFGSLCYSLLGLFFLYRSLLSFGGSVRHCILVTATVFFGTHLFFQALSAPSFSHNYSFFLFALLFFLTQRIIVKATIKNALLVGFTLGLIFLVRPTNVLVVLFLPFFFKSGGELGQFILRLFKFTNGILLSIILSTALVASILLMVYQWQTGLWFVWSYSGEGFYFLNPRIYETLFSYRIGLFVHTPIFVLVVVGLIKMVRPIPYQATIWIAYFTILLYITSSWWCWDYASTFGHRALSEHMILFAFPLLFLLENTSKSKLYYILIAIFSLYIWMRAYQRHTHIFPIQKFTPTTFWKSFGDFDSSIQGKYSSLEQCPPFGRIIHTTELISEDSEIELNQTEQFSKSISYEFPKEITPSRFIVEVTFNKHMLQEEGNWKDVLLVFDATNSQTNERLYYASGVYSYYRESIHSSEATTIRHEYVAELSPMEQLVVYFWNPEGKHIKIQDFRIKVHEYSAR